MYGSSSSHYSPGSPPSLLPSPPPPPPPPPPQDDTLEETGWKLVHGDVFRPPLHPTLLTACLGSGIQIFSMILIIIGRSEYINWGSWNFLTPT